MALDKQFVVVGTSSFVETPFGGWADSQSVAVSNASAEISFNGVDAFAIGVGEGMEFWDHLRGSIWVRGVGATVTVSVASRQEV